MKMSTSAIWNPLHYTKWVYLQFDTCLDRENLDVVVKIHLWLFKITMVHIGVCVVSVKYYLLLDVRIEQLNICLE